MVLSDEKEKSSFSVLVEIIKYKKEIIKLKKNLSRWILNRRIGLAEMFFIWYHIYYRGILIRLSAFL